MSPLHRSEPPRTVRPGRLFPARVAALAAALLGLFLAPDVGRTLADAPSGPARLTSRPRLPEPAAQPLAVGTELATGAGERRRLKLPDGSVLYVNQQTK